ncbi:MAG: YjjG family noncanonical pyrimidine nucleotidase [Flavobacteriales bacterium]
MIKKYKHFFFDLDGTLWDLYKNTEIALRQICSEFGMLEDDDSFKAFYKSYHYHNEQVWSLYRVGKIEKSVLRTIRFQKAFDEVGIEMSAEQTENFATRFLDVCPKLPHLIEGTHELLSFLYPHVKIHIITNGFKEVQGFKMDAGNLNQYITEMINSEDVGKRKPNPEIFEYALKVTGAKVEESLMIGDDWDADIVGARTFGMDQVFLTNTEIQQATILSKDGEIRLPRHNNSATFTVDKLSDLINILNK